MRNKGPLLAIQPVFGLGLLARQGFEGGRCAVRWSSGVNNSDVVQHGSPVTARNRPNMMFAAERDVNNYYYDQVMGFTQYPPQARNLEMVVPCEARAAGLIVVRPLAMATMGGL